jgi:hypothetical protein
MTSEFLNPFLVPSLPSLRHKTGGNGANREKILLRYLCCFLFLAKIATPFGKAGMENGLIGATKGRKQIKQARAML